MAIAFLRPQVEAYWDTIYPQGAINAVDFSRYRQMGGIGCEDKDTAKILVFQIRLPLNGKQVDFASMGKLVSIE